MNQQEIIQIMNSISSLDFDQMNYQDALVFQMALGVFAESIRPIIIKYADKLPENSSFLLKL